MEFKTFMSLTNLTVAEEIIKILSENKIDFKFQDTSKDFDVTFSNDSSKNSFLIMLKPIDFNIASKVLEDYTEFNIDEIDSQHPLFSFTNNELKNSNTNGNKYQRNTLIVMVMYIPLHNPMFFTKTVILYSN